MRNKILSASEQVAQHLRDELVRGRWSGTLPGIHRLSADLGFPRKPVERALIQLENEGVLEPQGVGKRRRITLPKGTARTGMLVGLLLYEPADHHVYEVVELRHKLLQTGFTVSIPHKTLTEMAMDVRSVARVVRATKADAWVVLAASRPVLEWFMEHDVPTIAYAGDYPSGMTLASVAPTKINAMKSMVDRLTALGHQRIVFLSASGVSPMNLLVDLESRGIATGSYNVPSWKRSPDGLRKCLDSLFATTPPTTLIIDEAPLLLAAQHHMERSGLFVPEDVSLVCTDPDPAFKWYIPTIAHIQWDKDPVVNRIVRWARNISQGKNDRRRTGIESIFVDGGTIGPVPTDKG